MKFMDLLLNITNRVQIYEFFKKVKKKKVVSFKARLVIIRGIKVDNKCKISA